MRSLITGPDDEWVLARSGREVSLLAAGAGPALSKLALMADDVDLAIVHGPPNVVIAATRDHTSTEVALHLPPELDAAARIELPAPAHIAATCAGRVVMVSSDQREMTIVRAAGRGLSAHAVDLQRATVEFVVGLERNQLVVGLPRRLEVWDAVSGRPLRKLALDLPPPPRTIGLAAGNLWVVRPNNDEVLAYRLSDGRPFQHYIGPHLDSVISHPNSPVIVFATPRGLVRLHCFAHSVVAIDCPWHAEAPVPLAQLVGGDDIALLGWPNGATEPWRVSINTTTTPATVQRAAVTGPIDQPPHSLVGSAARPGGAGVIDQPPHSVVGSAARPGGAGVIDSQSVHSQAVASPGFVGPGSTLPPRASGAVLNRGASSWRDELAAFPLEFTSGTQSAVPTVAVDTELGELAHRLGLGAPARRALTALYAYYLVGEPMLALATLARITGDWTEPLGQGQLEAFAMLHRSGGKLGLAREASDVLDGRSPREIRLLGGPAGVPRPGQFEISRNGRGNDVVETELTAQLGRIAVIETPRIAAGVLEARLHGATAVSFAIPSEPPRPWPQGAGLAVIVDKPAETA